MVGFKLMESEDSESIFLFFGFTTSKSETAAVEIKISKSWTTSKIASAISLDVSTGITSKRGEISTLTLATISVTSAPRI